MVGKAKHLSDRPSEFFRPNLKYLDFTNFKAQLFYDFFFKLVILAS